MLAYHNKPELKIEVLATMAAHRKADELVQGYGYWKDGKGCAVGCLLKNGNHREYEDKFGIPRALAFLEDRIFEGLPVNEAQQWPERFLGAIHTGADLSQAVAKLMLWLMTDPKGIRKHARPDGLKAIEVVAALYMRKLAGDEPKKEEWLSARRDADAAADAAAAAAADADAAAAAAAAAYAYAYAYADADADAAAAAAAAAAAYAAAARKKYFRRTADKLIDILAETNNS